MTRPRHDGRCSTSEMPAPRYARLCIPGGILGLFAKARGVSVYTDVNARAGTPPQGKFIERPRRGREARLDRGNFGGGFLRKRRSGGGGLRNGGVGVCAVVSEVVW